MKLEDLPTPCLVVDLDRVEANITRYQAAVSAAGTRFRPHAKTHKTIELARMQLDAGACGLTVAKVGEAEVYVDAGVEDVVVAYPVVGEEKWARLADLAGRAKIGVNVESEAAARGLSRAASKRRAEIHVHLDVDSGLGRCGIPPGEIENLERLAELVRSLPGLRLAGVTTYRGLPPGATGTDAAGQEEGGLAVGVARRLGLTQVSAGSTPTGMATARVDGITEVRAGTYVFNDLMQLEWGVASEDDLALSILATVVSRRGERITVDAGSKTLSGDARLADDHGPVLARGVGRDIVIERMNEEHGVGRSSQPLDIGDRVLLTPVHVCTCVNLSEALAAVRGGNVEAIWPVAARGKRT
jgi:D-serine deaminase-like pyridoxal phosphate-dependent protein